ncbi:NADPH:adrenodoxin oxidoreductase [Striga asiatica]|uniref:NADPH:adrenodoxin oxidoreductase n=1 Tax=Striga asiatica TaxID=4170 RepID=A0A5A7RA41_STRAF|nr:NADPH:adrenodoxin oxidoreductase [Striga asiatica]
MKNNRIRRRVYELLSKAASLGHAPVPCQHELHFVFFRKPERFLESDDKNGHHGSVRLEKTVLKGDDELKQVAVGTGVSAEEYRLQELFQIMEAVCWLMLHKITCNTKLAYMCVDG